MAGTDTLGIVGSMLAEKYAVESVVGEGGFATVYRAKHLIWNRPVALKVFKALGDFSAADREKLLQEFVQEGALLAELSERSAAICQARDIGMLTTPGGDKIPYMVLEWLEGLTLEQVLEREQLQALAPRTMDEAVRLIDPAAEALALAHRQGIAHRDVKPGNLFLLGDPRGEACAVKVLDFGIAKVVSDAQRLGGAFTKTKGHVTAFTPAYGAPEQFSRTHGATGPWTDVFSLALIVVEMVTGRAPLDGDDYVQLAVAAASPSIRPTPRTFGASVSDEVEAVFLRALAVKPMERHQTVGDFWNALRLALRMAPMHGLTAPNPSSTRGGVVPANGDASMGNARTMVATHEPVSTRSASLPSTFATNARPAPSKRAPLVTTLGALAVLGVGAAVYFVGFANKPASSGAREPASSSAGSAPTAAEAPTAGPSASAALPVASACPAEMATIPGGKFFMGSDDGLPFEKPAHQVAVKPYCIDKHEVTVADYKACSDKGECLRAAQTNEWAKIEDNERKAYDPLCTIRDPESKARHPINCVTWEQAENFCRGHGKRLPTEAEWEFAARGPDGRKYPWGDDEPTAEHLNACGTECLAWAKKWNIEITRTMFARDDGHAGTAPVGSFPKGASPYGVEDVVGNVWEWVGDWYGEYTKDDQVAPTGPKEGEKRVIRGGAWNAQYPSWVRPTFRYQDAPTTRSHGIGFRCAR